jgi:hypothetical protein
MAEALVRASDASTKTEMVRSAIVESLIELQDLIKRLFTARSANNVQEELSIQKTLEGGIKRFCATLDYGVDGYANLINKVGNLRFPGKMSAPANLFPQLEQDIAVQESTLLPGGLPLGRRMGMLINHVAYRNIATGSQKLMDFTKRDTARLALEIDEDLAQSQALKDRITQLRANEETFVEEEPPETDYSVDELPDSEEEQQRWIEFYQNKLQIGEAIKPKPSEAQTPRRPTQPPAPAKPTTSTRPKPTQQSSVRTEMDDKIDRYIALYFWNDLREGKLKYGIPGIEIDTPLDTKLFLSVGRLRHILKRHFPKTFDPTLAKGQNTLFDRSITVSDIIPMLRKIGTTLNPKQLRAHYAKMKVTPSGIPVLSRIEGTYRGKRSWFCLLDNRVMTEYPEE